MNREITQDEELLYFAYGSNLHPHRLRERVPSARALAVARLTGYALRFHKRGRDGSGKCNIHHTGRPADRVFGAVYVMAAGERARLDGAEGLGAGYRLAWLDVYADDTPHTVFSYIAETGHIDDTLSPFDWYHQLVLAGARHHGLPNEYVAAIGAVAAYPDPDAERHALHQRLLQRSLTQTL